MMKTHTGTQKRFKARYVTFIRGDVKQWFALGIGGRPAGKNGQMIPVFTEAAGPEAVCVQAVQPQPSSQEEPPKECILLEQNVEGCDRTLPEDSFFFDFGDDVIFGETEPSIPDPKAWEPDYW
jgi:hypothetical protein